MSFSGELCTNALQLPPAINYSAEPSGKGNLSPGVFLIVLQQDQLSLAVLAIANQRVKVCIGVAEVRALSVWTGETLGIDAFGGTSPAFDLAPGTH